MKCASTFAEMSAMRMWHVGADWPGTGVDEEWFDPCMCHVPTGPAQVSQSVLWTIPSHACQAQGQLISPIAALRNEKTSAECQQELASSLHQCCSSKTA